MRTDPATSEGVIPATLRLASDGAEETRALAAALADVLVVGDLLVLSGDLGAGKTCFTQGLGRGLGVDEPITSPTFTLANRHEGRLVLHHLDAYRLDGPGDAADLDLDDLLETGVTVIEWGNRIAQILPVDRFTITLRYPDPAGTEDDGAIDESGFDRRAIELDGPIVERDLGVVLAPWVAGRC